VMKMMTCAVMLLGMLTPVQAKEESVWVCDSPSMATEYDYGRGEIMITNHENTDSYVKKTVSVEKNSVYRLSAKARFDGTGKGAAFTSSSAIDDGYVSENVWTDIECYIESYDNDTVDLYLYNNGCGTAVFSVCEAGEDH